jgi:hypothetical protein
VSASVSHIQVEFTRTQHTCWEVDFLPTWLQWFVLYQAVIKNWYSNLKNRLFMDSVSSNHPNFDAIMYPHGTQFRLVVFSVAKRHLSGFKTQWVDD